MAEKPVKAEQVLKIEPKSELHFKGPYTEIATEYLILTNPSDRKVCFKIKTTAPKRYCVRPNSGIIEPKNSSKIAVMLQPSPPVDSQQINEFKNKHKFMVQTTFANDDLDGEVNQENLWKKVEPSAIMESKLKCVFDLQYIEENENSDSIKESNLVSLTSSTKSNEDTGISNTEPSMASTVYAKQPIDESAIVKENRSLREELIILRLELMQAKEEGLKKRISDKPQTHGPTYGDDKLENESQNTDQLVLKNNTHILFFALVFFVIGLIFGKILI